MRIFITNTFKRSAKRMYAKEIQLLEEAIEKIRTNPLIGESKKRDLNEVRVYKFHLFHQLTLLAYLYDEHEKEVTLLSFASHENFYDDLKKQIKKS